MAHPTQKALDVIRWCIEEFSKPGQTILDPLLGSGTTAVAAKQLGRHFIGIEREPEYVRIAEQRLRESKRDVLAVLTEGGDLRDGTGCVHDQFKWTRPVASSVEAIS